MRKVVDMKYPILSNWIIYKKIPGCDMYYIKDCVLKSKCVISSEMMGFARKLDGKTNPYLIKGERSKLEIKELLEELDFLGVIRTDHGVVLRGIDGYARTLIRTKNTRIKRIIAKYLNFLLILLFVPILVAGIYVYLNTDIIRYTDLNMVEQAIDKYPIISVWISGILGIICGGIVHELCHGIACRAYGGRVFEYGITLEILPGFYTLLDDSNIKSRLKKVQIAAAGIEGNLIFAGGVLLVVKLLPGVREVLLVMAVDNIAMTIINIIAMKDTDGFKILMLLIGMDNSNDPQRVKNIVRNKNRELFIGDDFYGYIKLIACYMIIWIQKVLPLVILLEIIACIGELL